MSRRIALSITSIIAITVLLFALGTAVLSAAGFKLGDANGNGEIEIVDAVIVQRVVADIYDDKDGMITRRADIDGSGGLDVTDATLIQRHLADIPTPYTVGEIVKPTYPTDPYELPVV